MPYLLLLFVGLPLLELYFLIQIGSVIGAVPTIALSIFTAVLGSWLVRRQGFGVLMRVRESLARDEVPALDLLDGVLILAAGLVLLLPGFLTDILGFLMLIPPLRRWVVRRYVQVIPVHRHDPEPTPSARVIEGYFRRVDKE